MTESLRSGGSPDSLPPPTTEAAQELHHLAMESALMGHWDWDLVADEVTWSSEQDRVTGSPSQEIRGNFEEFIRRVHDADRTALERALRQAIERGEDFRAEFRVVRPDASVHWVAAHGRTYTDANGRALRVIGVVQDITVRKRAEDDRARLLEWEQRARRDAEQAARVKDEFLATVSHELRTPLTAILLWARMLSAGEVCAADLPEAFSTIERSAEAQSQLIEDLLDVSRMLSGKLRLTLRRAALCPIVGAAVDAVRPLADAKSIKIHVVLQDDMAPVRVDPERIQQVVWNLLTNAVKFTPAGGWVNVTVRGAADRAEIVVADTGKGIAREFLSRVFDRFEQADSTTTRSQGGLGLGLAIVRQLVQLHDGTVRADSAGPGQGSTFVVELPALDPSSADDLESDPPPASQPQPGMFEPRALSGCGVMLVEDDADSRRALQKVLEQAGARVGIADAAEQALAVMRQESFDVLLSDISMPEEDGYSLIHRIRAGEGGPSNHGIRAAALTAYARAEDRQRSLDAGFEAHLSKPIDPATLISTVATLLGRAPLAPMPETVPDVVQSPLETSPPGDHS